MSQCLVSFCHVAAALPIRLKALGNRDETFSSRRGKGWGRRYPMWGCTGLEGTRGPGPAPPRVRAAPQPLKRGRDNAPSPPVKVTLVWRELGASRRGKFHPGAACSPPKSGSPRGGRAGRRAPALARPQGSTATVNAGSDFPCLRLLVLAAEPPQEQPDRGRLENNPPTASTAGVNASGLLLP